MNTSHHLPRPQHAGLARGQTACLRERTLCGSGHPKWLSWTQTLSIAEKAFHGTAMNVKLGNGQQWLMWQCSVSWSLRCYHGMKAPVERRGAFPKSCPALRSSVSLPLGHVSVPLTHKWMCAERITTSFCLFYVLLLASIMYLGLCVHILAPLQFCPPTLPHTPCCQRRRRRHREMLASEVVGEKCQPCLTSGSDCI